MAKEIETCRGVETEIRDDGVWGGKGGSENEAVRDERQERINTEGPKDEDIGAF